MIPWLETPAAFPANKTALTEPNGLLAAGGALTPDWLLAAYRRGIFPWFSKHDPILWWSPTPRMVLFPHEARIRRSLLKVLRAERFSVRCDTAFRQVMLACAAPRNGASGTWITKEMIDAYCTMHELGWAHSVEAWQDDTLVGGLYGIAIGRAFFGESMFHRATDASKVAFAHLAKLLDRERFAIADCQMSTAHLASLGAREIQRDDFVAGLQIWTQESVNPRRWPTDFAQHAWNTECPS